MRALLVCLTIAVVAALATDVERANACSCIQPNPWSLMKEADGAFVGRLADRDDIGRGRVRLRFDVERAVKGNIGATVDVVTANNSAACGIELPVGSRIGLFLSREGGRWFGTLCWQVSPEDLLAAAALPAPNGRWPVAMYVGGRFGPARTIALDAKGRTLGYGLGSGDLEDVSGCPGGRRVVELVRRGSGDFAVVREVPSFWLVREQRLPRRGEGVGSVRCIDPLGDELALFTSGPDARGRLLRVTPREVSTLWRGTAFHTSFSKQVAYVQVPLLRRSRTRLVRVELRTGVTKVLGTVPVEGLYELAPNAAGTRLAGSAFVEGCRASPCAYLAAIDLRTEPISARKIPLRAYATTDVAWITGETFAFATRDAIRVYTASLRLTNRTGGWTGGRPVVLGRTAYGIGRERLVSTQLPGKPVQVVRRFPGTPTFITAAR